MRELNTQVVRPKLNKGLAVLKVSGFINAETLMEFEGLLDELLMESRRDLILDCQELGYVNSSGIAAILNYQQSFQAQGGDLMLVRVPRGIAVVLRNLGTTGSLAVLTDEQEAMAYLERDAKGTRRWAGPAPFLRERHPSSTPGEGKPRAVLPLLKPEGRPSADRSILVIDPTANDFTDVVRLRYNGKKGKVLLVNDCVSALTQFDRANPDVIILHDAVPNAEEFLAKVKADRGKSLASVIRIYPNGAAPRSRDFRIRENDAFMEPFEIGELFALAELELRRVPRSRAEFQHLSSFDFLTTPPSLERAHRLARSLLSTSGMGEDEASGFLAAFKESLDNAARHAHGGNPAKRCTVHFLLDAAKATFLVQDEGPGFDHAYYTSQLANEDAYVRARRAKAEGKQGGLGILLMHKNCDALRYEGHGNRLRLEKRLA